MSILKPIGLLLILANLLNAQVIKSNTLSISIDSNGIITNLANADNLFNINGTAATELSDCTINNSKITNKVNGIEIVRLVSKNKSNLSCKIIENIYPSGDGLQWDIMIEGTGEPWSVPIITHIKLADSSVCNFWTAWGTSGITEQDKYRWQSPLRSDVFKDRDLTYGSNSPDEFQITSLPIATVMVPKSNEAFSLYQSLDDLIFNMRIKTSQKGDIIFERSNHRIVKGSKIKFSMFLVGHKADCRAAMKSIVDRFPKKFFPPVERTYLIAGHGGYSSFEGPLDARTLHLLGYGFNWKASFDYPYMGMFIPPVDQNEKWVGDLGRTVNISQMRQYSVYMRKMGFHVLNYFNVAEFGKNVDFESVTKPLDSNVSNSELWKDCTSYIRKNFQDAIMYWKDGQGVRRIAGAWEGGVLLDFSTPNFSRFLVNQIHRHLEMLPESSGFCIDRTDFIRWLNDCRDDGVSWDNGPRYSMVLGWNDLMNKIGPIVTKADKVIYCNPLYCRVDLYEHISGYYSEVATNSMINAISLMGLKKPVVMWTQGGVKNVDDYYIQLHLHMGSFMTAPIPENNHTIRDQGKELDDRYIDYGLMFDALRGRHWVLEPGIINFTQGQGDLNIFEIPGGFVVFATWVPENYKQVEINLNNLPSHVTNLSYQTFTAVTGDTEWKKSSTISGKDINVSIPISRGCGAITLMYNWMTPEEESFENSIQVKMSSTLTDSEIRYTLDGSIPNETSKIYTSPVDLEKTAMVKMAVFSSGKRIGRDICREYVKTPPRALYIEPYQGGIVPIEARLINPYNNDVEMRFSTDGSEPNESSGKYVAPIKLTKNMDLKAKLYKKNGCASIMRQARFRMLPPLPPKPTISIVDIKPLAVPQEYRIGTSWNGNNFILAGKDFGEDGILLKPSIGSNFSDIVYQLKPEYERFVAVIGIDADGGSPESSVIYKIYFDKGISQQSINAVAEEEPYWQSELLKQNEYWVIDLPIPKGQTIIRLRVSNGGDDQNGDYAAWVDAGFVGKNIIRIPKPNDIADPNAVVEVNELVSSNLTNISASGTCKASSIFEPCRQMQSNDLLDASLPSSLFAFSTDNEKNANVVIDLKQVSQIDAVQILNRTDAGQEIIDRAKYIGLYISDDGLNWKKLWQASEGKPFWSLSMTKPVSGRYIKLQLSNKNFLHLKRVYIYKKKLGAAEC